MTIKTPLMLALAGALLLSGCDIRNDGHTTILDGGKYLTINTSQDLLFDPGSANLRPDADIASIARVLQRYPNYRFEVVGHTDSVGGTAYNKALSERRASAVAAALLQNGVEASRLNSYGRGELKPIASNRTAEGRAQNRRVQIILIWLK